MDTASRTSYDAPVEDRSRGDRIQTLDAVRSIAILLVIGHHAAYRFSGSNLDPIAALLRSVGWIGVDIFFALSGFLIVRILVKDSSSGDVTGFFVRRFWRIVPLYVVALFVFAAGTMLTGLDAQLLSRIWIPALLLNGWAIPLLGIDGVPYLIAWSLSVEEFSYLVFGLAALALSRGLVVAVCLFLIVANGLRWSTLALDLFEPSYLYFFVPARLDAIAFGGLGALGFYRSLTNKAWCGPVAGWMTLLLVVLFQWAGGIGGWFLPAFGYALFGFSCGVWVTCLAHGQGPQNIGLRLAVRLLAPFGKLSYFIYLFHLFVLEAIRIVSSRMGVDLQFWTAMLCAIPICFLLARVSWRHFEYPLIRRSHGRPSPGD